MKILLINPPGKTSVIAPPLGLAYLSSALKTQNHFVILKDYILEKFVLNDFLSLLQKENIELVGLTAVTPNIKNALALAQIIKRAKPRIKIVLGGPHATLKPKETMEICPQIDFIVRGEGEVTLLRLVGALRNERELTEIQGLAFRNNGEVIINPPAAFIENLDQLPLPDRGSVSPLKYSRHAMTKHQPSATILTSRGCPFNCIYCSKPICGNNVRYRSIDRVIEEIEMLWRDYKIRELVFYDDTFTLNRERTIEFCRQLIAKDLPIAWKCETRVNLIDEELLTIMKKSGCYLIGYGFESGNQKVLNVLKKGSTIEQARKAADLTKRAGIEILGYFMLGIPGETEEEIDQTIRLAKELNPDYAQFSIATAYPGCELYDLAKEQNKLPDNFQAGFYALGGPGEIISLCQVTAQTLQEKLKSAYRSFYFRPAYIWSKMKKLNSWENLAHFLRGFKTLLKI